MSTEETNALDCKPELMRDDSVQLTREQAIEGFKALSDTVVKLLPTAKAVSAKNKKLEAELAQCKAELAQCKAELAECKTRLRDSEEVLKAIMD